MCLGQEQTDWALIEMLGLPPWHIFTPGGALFYLL